MLDICMVRWTEFYFMAKSISILITVGAIAIIGVIVLFCWLWDLFTKLVHKITTKGKDWDLFTKLVNKITTKGKDTD